MNETTVFDRNDVEARAAKYGSSLHVSPPLGKDDTPLYEIPLSLDPIDGRVDVSYSDATGRWDVDPYFHWESQMTPDQARAVAKVFGNAADLADELNGPSNVAGWDEIRHMTIDELADYAKSIGSTASAVFEVARPK